MKRILHLNLAQAIKLMLITLMCLPVWSTTVQAQTKEAYAVLDEATGTLTFKYDAAKPEGAYDIINYGYYPGWHSSADKITKIVIEPSFADARPTQCRYWFSDCRVKEIEGIEYLNTSEVTTMDYMFSNCNSLIKLDVSKFNTEKVTTFESMFDNCCSFTSIDVSSFNTEKATNMRSMFDLCRELTSLDVSNFNTSNVTNMTEMFARCWKLTSLDLSNLIHLM